MKKIKVLLYLLITLITFKTVDVKAFSISASSQTVYAGDRIVISVNTAGIYGTIQSSSDNNSVINGGATAFAKKYTDEATYFYFTAVNPGQANIIISSTDDTYYDDNSDCHESRSITINVINRQTNENIDINHVYSDNNYLAGIGVEGFEIKEEFERERLEYSLEVDYTVEKINILTSLEDQTANVVGAGEVEISEGNNEIKIIVQAENGNERTYTINVLVKEIDPIEITIDKDKYTVVKKDKLLPEVDGFEKTSVMINDVEIPALYNETTDYMLVGLKNNKGKIKLFIYDSKDNTYTEFKELKLNGIKLNYLTPENTKYKVVDIEINGKKIKAYKKDGLDYYLIYGMNLETGNINWYTYDKEENTLQRYIEKEEDVSETKQSSFVIILLGSISAVLIIFLLILAFKKNKNIF